MASLLLLASPAVSTLAHVKPGMLPAGDVIWPRPNSLKLGGTVSLCVKSLHFQLSKTTPIKHIREAIAIYTPLILHYKGDAPCTELTSVIIDCPSCESNSAPIRTDITDISLHLDLYSLSIT